MQIQLITSRRMRWARHVAYMREKRNAYIFSFGKPKGTRLLGRHGHRSEINMNTDLIEYDHRAWTRLIWLWTGTSGRLL
jgi:hypothetical protein